MATLPSPDEGSYKSDDDEQSTNILKRKRVLSPYFPQETCVTNPHTFILPPSDDERKLAAIED